MEGTWEQQKERKKFIVKIWFCSILTFCVAHCLFPLWVPIHPIVRLHFSLLRTFLYIFSCMIRPFISLATHAHTHTYIYWLLDACLLRIFFISYTKENEREKNKRIALKIHLREDDFQSICPVEVLCNLKCLLCHCVCYARCLSRFFLTHRM